MMKKLGLWIIFVVFWGGSIAASPVSAQNTIYCNSAAVQYVTYNTTVVGTIDDEVTVRGYCFEGRAGDVVTLTVFTTSGDLDPQVMIFDENLDDVLAYNDDISATNPNAELTYTLEYDGRYAILVSRYDVARGTTSGEYRLIIRGQSLQPAPPPSPTPNIAPTDATEHVNVCDSPLTIMLEYGDTFRALIDDLRVGYAYCFFGEANDVIEIEAIAKTRNLDTLLYLADPFFETIYASNDDIDHRNSNSAIREFVLPETGQYLIVVTRFGEEAGQTSGEYEITLRQLDTPPVVTAPECDDPFLLTLSAGPWQSLVDETQTLQFFCDGRVIWGKGALKQAGIFNADEDVIIITLTDSGETFVWGDVLVVEGFLTATELQTNERIYFTAFINTR